MKPSPRWLTLTTLALTTGLALRLGLPAMAENQTQNMLFEQVSAALKLENAVYVSGQVPAAIADHPQAKPLLKYFQPRIARYQQVALARSRTPGPKYQSGEVKCKLLKSSIHSDSATLEVEAKTIDYFDAASIAAGSPKQTESIVQHKFVFARVNGVWDLVSTTNNDVLSLENRRPQ